MKKLTDDLTGPTLLRTLTYKSTMGFGKYAGMTVARILRHKRIHYLIWVYYNCANISFTDDILIELGIFKRNRIVKPGKDFDLFMTVLPKIEDKTHSKKIKARKQHQHDNINKAKSFTKQKFTSKGYMQGKNHGH